VVKHSIEISRTAEKQLEALPRREAVRVLQAIQRLETNARPTGCRKLEGHSNTFRVRVGMYRIIYDVDDYRVVIVVLKVGHRRDIYR